MSYHGDKDLMQRFEEFTTTQAAAPLEKIEICDIPDCGGIVTTSDVISVKRWNLCIEHQVSARYRVKE